MPKAEQACAGSAVGAVATRPLARNDDFMRRRPAPERRPWIVESDFRTSGSMPREEHTITPDVPFCADLRLVMAVLLARDSAPERVRSTRP